MFHSEPEGRYSHRQCTAISCLVLTGTSLNIINALLAINLKMMFWGAVVFFHVISFKMCKCFLTWLFSHYPIIYKLSDGAIIQNFDTASSKKVNHFVQKIFQKNHVLTLDEYNVPLKQLNRKHVVNFKDNGLNSRRFIIFNQLIILNLLTTISAK